MRLSTEIFKIAAQMIEDQRLPQTMDATTSPDEQAGVNLGNPGRSALSLLGKVPRFTAREPDPKVVLPSGGGEAAGQ